MEAEPVASGQRLTARQSSTIGREKMNRSTYILRVATSCALWLPAFLLLLHDDHLLLTCALIFSAVYIHPRKRKELTEKEWLKAGLQLVVILPIISILIGSPEANELSFTPLGYALRFMLWVSVVHSEWKELRSNKVDLEPQGQPRPIQSDLDNA